MIVPVLMLEKLKCSNCENLLSCGPVLVKHDGSNLCGRCSNLKLDEPTVPNQPYNALAELCAFPCKYEAEGCVKKLPFDSVQRHEQDCEFRQYICPIMASGTCEWVGSKNMILEHTQEAHPDLVLQQSCRLKHDVRKASSKTFLTTAFNLLFVVYVKVCVDTHILYHSVRKIGEIHESRTYKYQLNIENDNGLVMRKGDVAPQGCLSMQEDTSIAIKINSLMETLGCFNNTTFTLTLQEFMKCFNCEIIKNVEQGEVYDQINHIFYCKTCLSTLKSCKNKSEGCLWKGQSSNHKNFLCTYTKTCNICDEEIGKFNNDLDHMRSKNHVTSQLNHLFENYWTINNKQVKENETMSINFKNKSYFLMYVNKENRFFMQGQPGDTNLKFIVILRNPKTKYTAHYIMNKNYTFIAGQFVFNLYVDVNTIQSFSHENKFEVGVDMHNYE